MQEKRKVLWIIVLVYLLIDMIDVQLPFEKWTWGLQSAGRSCPTKRFDMRNGYYWKYFNYLVLLLRKRCEYRNVHTKTSIGVHSLIYVGFMENQKTVYSLLSCQL